MNIEQVMTDAVTNIVRSGKIEVAIENAIAKTVEESLTRSLTTYSEFGKLIEAAVKKAVQVEVGRIDLPDYSDMVIKLVARQVDAALGATLERQVSENLKTIIAAPPAELTVQQLVDEFKQHVDMHCRCHSGGGQISVDIWEGDSTTTKGYWHLHMDEDSNKDRWGCKYKLAITPDGEVYSMQLQGLDIEKRMFIGPYFGFERYMFALKVNKTKLIRPDNVHDLDLELEESYS